MSEASDLAAMLCGGKPEHHEAASVAQVYMNVGVLILLQDLVHRADDPRAKANELLLALHTCVKSRIDAEIKQLRTVNDSSIGKIFGSMLPNAEETSARMQDRVNEVHANIAQFLLSGLPPQDESIGVISNTRFRS